jgi:hypothetical protein
MISMNKRGNIASLLQRTGTQSGNVVEEVIFNLDIDLYKL